MGRPTLGTNTTNPEGASIMSKLQARASDSEESGGFTELALAGSKLAWSLACNTRHPDRLDALLQEFIDGRDSVECVGLLYGALMVLTTQALEPALTVGDQAHKSLRREFAIALKNIEAMNA
jgi:hypothetical protein